jgi:hypothetical protein
VYIEENALNIMVTSKEGKRETTQMVIELQIYGHLLSLNHVPGNLENPVRFITVTTIFCI